MSVPASRTASPEHAALPDAQRRLPDDRAPTGPADVMRVLVVDDESMLLRLFGRVLAPGAGEPGRPGQSAAACDAMEPDPPRFELTTCAQAERAVAHVRASIDDGRPFALAFVDVELPPGQNGVWAAERIRRLDPNVEIVVVTAHSTVSVAEIAARVPPLERLTYLKKPLHVEEIRHLALSLGARWRRQAALRDRLEELEGRVRGMQAGGAAPAPRQADANPVTGRPDVSGARDVPCAGTVLIAEDESTVRRLASRILSRKGYHVLEAEDGTSALALLDDAAGPVDILLTDLDMPDMCGHRLADAVASRSPETRVVFMSGGLGEGLAERRSDARFVQKPFRAADLLEVIGEACAGRARQPSG